jgi:hypothetical protein
VAYLSVETLVAIQNCDALDGLDVDADQASIDNMLLLPLISSD